MIDTSQWRASIGLWNSSILRCGGSSGYGSCLIELSCLSVLVVLVLLLLLSGDVELNPGPKTDITPQLHHLMNILAEISHKYSDIGVALNVPDLGFHPLPQYYNDNLRRTLQWWLDKEPTVGSPVTYDNIINAIKGPIVQNFRVSENLREFYEKLLEENQPIPSDLGKHKSTHELPTPPPLKQSKLSSANDDQPTTSSLGKHKSSRRQPVPRKSIILSCEPDITDEGPSGTSSYVDRRRQPVPRKSIILSCEPDITDEGPSTSDNINTDTQPSNLSHQPTNMRATDNLPSSTNGPSNVVPNPPSVHCPPMRNIKPKLTQYTPDLVKDVNVILVTATENEFRAVMGQAIPLGGRKEFNQVSYGTVTFYLGMYGKNKVAIVRTDQGGRNTREGLGKVQEVVKAKYVIAVGICYGMKEDKVKLGDVIVAKHIMDLTDHRANLDGTLVARPVGNWAGKHLYNILKESAGFALKSGDGPDDYVDIKTDGVLVSETTLVASQEYKDQILRQIPQALGGEMEGAAIMELADGGKFEAIVVKAVADYGNGNKQLYVNWKIFAAVASTKYILYHLERTKMKGHDMDQIQGLMVTQEFPTSHQMHSNIPSDTSSYVDQSSHQLPSPDDTSNDNMIQSEVAIVEGNTLDSTNLSSLPVTHQPTNKPAVTFDTYVCGEYIIETKEYLFTYYGGRYHQSSVIKFTTPMSPMLNYFEYEIIDKGEMTRMMIDDISIGVGEHNHPLYGIPGWTRGSIGYNADDGKVYKKNKMKASGPPCTIGDRMGCGINFDASLPSGYVYVFFTKNGIQFSEPIPMKQPPDGLYSLIGLGSKGDKVHYLGHWRRDLDLIQELMVTQEFPTSHQMHSNIPPADVQQYCNIMRNKYKDYQPYISDWPPKLKCGQQYFGRLTLTDRNTTPNRQWSMSRGHTDNVPEGPGKIIEIVDLIKPNESGQYLRAVVDGPPGVGKTTLCRILLNMWATKEHIKHLYDLVLYCPLRNDKIAQANELKDLFLFRNSKVSKAVEWLEDTDGERVLMIFDGWDELSTQLKRSSLPTSIIQREILDKCSVLVTSRTYATSSLLNLTSHHKHVQVMGFSLDQIKMVIRGTLEEPHLAKKLIKDLKVRGDVLSLCYIPLVCSMVIYVYGKLKGQLPTTLTQLYEKFILQTIRRHIQRNVDSYEPQDIFGLDNLPTDVGRDFKKLCQFAYLNLKENNPKMTFSSLELQLHMKQSGYLGLITEYGEDGNQFLHLSIQEFLASWWIAKYEEKTQEIFNENFDNDHFKMSLRFTAGLTHLEPNENYQQYFNKQLDLQCKRRPWFGFDDCYRSRLYKNHEIRIGGINDNHIITDDSNEFAILLLQLLYESQNTQLCSTLAQSMMNHSLCLRNLRLSLFDTLCVSYFLNNSNITWNHLDLGRLYEQQVQLLNNTLTINSQHNKCKILEVELVDPTMETIKLFQLPLFQECYVGLYESQCNPFLYLVELLKLHNQLKILHFSSLADEDESIEEFPQLIKLLNNSTLQEIYIDSDRDHSNELTSLCNGVAMNKTITSFTLKLHYRRSLSEETIQQLLMNNHTIQALDLKTDHLPSVNIVNTPLTTLRLGGRYTSDQLTSFLPHIKGLQCLILPKCHSYPPNLIFQSLPSLQQLEISLYTVEEAIELFTILQSNVTLKALRVWLRHDHIYNRIGDSLCDMLRLNQTIKYLEIERERWQRSIPSKSFLSYLTTGLSHNTSLQELSVPIPLSPTNNEQIITFFNVISKMNNLTELKVNFILYQFYYSNSSSDEEELDQLFYSNFCSDEELYYEHVLPSLTNMIMSHSSIRLLHVTCDDDINHDLSQPNWVESVEQLYQSIFIHPSLEYIRINETSLLEDILQKQKKTLIDKRKQQQLLKPTPTIEFISRY